MVELVSGPFFVEKLLKVGIVGLLLGEEPVIIPKNNDHNEMNNEKKA